MELQFNGSSLQVRFGSEAGALLASLPGLIAAQLPDAIEDTIGGAVTAFAMTLLDDANAAAARTTLGLGTAAVLSTADIDERARDALGAALVEGAGFDFTVNDGSDTITLTVDASEIEATDSEMWTGTSTGKVVTPNKLFDMAVPQALTDGATVTPDFNAGINFEWTIGGNRTLANATNAKPGQSGTIKIVQDATGSRVVTYGNNWRFPGGSASGGVLSTAANAIDLLAYTVGNDGKIYATLSKAFAA